MLACLYLLLAPGEESVQLQQGLNAASENQGSLFEESAAGGTGTAGLVQESDQGSSETFSPASAYEVTVPPYTGNGAIVVNYGVPFFTEEEKQRAREGSFEDYGELDSLGRCTAAMGCLGRETMPAKGEKRGDISSIHPTGWKQARYDCVDSETVMTRAHLIGWMLGAENSNPKNLITGTRYMNSDSMLEYEEAVSDYIYHNKNCHVLYRVTPLFEGSNLMADGIVMEGWSVEDNGDSICMCIYVYNVQPGLEFNYQNGKSRYNGIFMDTDSDTVITDGIRLKEYTLVNSTNTIHDSRCSELQMIDRESKTEFAGDADMVDSWKSFGYNLCSCLKR